MNVVVCLYCPTLAPNPDSMVQHQEQHPLHLRPYYGTVGTSTLKDILAMLEYVAADPAINSDSQSVNNQTLHVDP